MSSELLNTLNRLGESYLVIDVQCLFVAASLREEMWLYLKREDTDLLAQVSLGAAVFNIRGVTPDRELITYSGGEQAILACLLILALIRTLNVKGLQLLLNGVLESVSYENRQRLCRQFDIAAQSHLTKAYQLQGRKLHPVGVAQCA